MTCTQVALFPKPKVVRSTRAGGAEFEVDPSVPCASGGSCATRRTRTPDEDSRDESGCSPWCRSPWLAARYARHNTLTLVLIGARWDISDPMDDVALAEGRAKAATIAGVSLDRLADVLAKWNRGEGVAMPYPLPGMCDPPPRGAPFVPESASWTWLKDEGFPISIDDVPVTYAVDTSDGAHEADPCGCIACVSHREAEANR